MSSVRLSSDPFWDRFPQAEFRALVQDVGVGVVVAPAAGWQASENLAKDSMRLENLVLGLAAEGNPMRVAGLEPQVDWAALESRVLAAESAARQID